MKPPIEYRQPRPASSSGRTPDFGSGKPGSNPGAGTKLKTAAGGSADAILAEIRRKARDRQRKHRENLKKGGK